MLSKPTAKLLDDLQLRPGGVEQLVVDRIGEEREQAVLAGGAAEQLVARRRQLVRPQVDSQASRMVQAGVGDDAGDEDARPIWPSEAAPDELPGPLERPSDSAMRSSAARFSRELA